MDHGGRQGAQLNTEGCEDKAIRFGVGESFSHTGEAEPVVPVSRPPCPAPEETGTECRGEGAPGGSLDKVLWEDCAMSACWEVDFETACLRYSCITQPTC